LLIGDVQRVAQAPLHAMAILPSSDNDEWAYRPSDRGVNREFKLVFRRKNFAGWRPRLTGAFSGPFSDVDLLVPTGGIRRETAKD